MGVKRWLMVRFYLNLSRSFWEEDDMGGSSPRPYKWAFQTFPHIWTAKLPFVHSVHDTLGPYFTAQAYTCYRLGHALLAWNRHRMSSVEYTMRWFIPQRGHGAIDVSAECPCPFAAIHIASRRFLCTHIKLLWSWKCINIKQPHCVIKYTTNVIYFYFNKTCPTQLWACFFFTTTMEANLRWGRKVKIVNRIHLAAIILAPTN